MNDYFIHVGNIYFENSYYVKIYSTDELILNLICIFHYFGVLGFWGFPKTPKPQKYGKCVELIQYICKYREIH